MHYELNQGVPAIAVGLSAISFSATLQKDAAPIPNALAAMSIELRAMSKVAESVETLFISQRRKELQRITLRYFAPLRETFSF
ncbi:MAG: hypothetical protein IIW55_04395 [Bacteroidales bacterium]|nr:hypothetical protein [Bacteroidales bacterium]